MRLAVLLALSLPLPAGAGRISLQPRASAALQRGRVRVELRLTHAGDEPARAVWAEAALDGRAERTAPREEIAAGETVTLAFELGPPPALPGTYTAVARVHYEDATGRPFSILASVPVVTAEPAPPEDLLRARLSPAEIMRAGELSLELAGTGPTGLHARVALFVPAELEISPAATEVRLGPGEQRTLRFAIRNRSALPGSAYAVLAVLDYTHAGQHRSVAAPSHLRLSAAPSAFAARPGLWGAVVVGLLALWLCGQLPQGRRWAVAFEHSRLARCFPALVLAAILAFTLQDLPPRYLLLDTLAVGGDTPAHNYLASHLRETLFSRGRIVSWAGGWWCGFPMFQFYFCLPYLLVTLLDLLLPFNVAFKLVSVLGALALPSCAWAAARLFRLPRPAALLLAVAMVPLLFDASHTMWGVNLYSTLAGMIANSLSFPLMLLFVASAARDTDEGRFRFLTVWLLVLLLASHFFTSVFGLLAAAALPFLRPLAGTRRALSVLVREGALAGLLMAWWLVPLAAKREFSMEFGVNWKVDLAAHLPRLCWTLTPLLAVAAVLGARRRLRFVAVTAWILLAALTLFHFGYDHVSPVFVNVRLWPFLVYALLALPAAGAGLLLAAGRAPEPAVLAALIAVLTWGIGRPNHVREWAAWNYAGLQQKRGWPVFRELILPLRGTPGRLANDLHPDNNALGSSRVFECVPHLIGKPVLEGGTVNSAVGALCAYYVQGETSRQSAGFPTRLRPAAFNATNATRHLELCNVKHFVARWTETKQALAGMTAWRLLRESREWALYELTTHDGRYVYVPRFRPAAVRTADRKQAGLEWLYEIHALDQPFALLPDRPPPGGPFANPLTEAEFRRYLEAVGTRGFYPLGAPTAPLPWRPPASPVSDEQIGDERIRFRTVAVGQPHIIKCSYYPNWKAVRGARAVYPVTPFFMLVYPEAEEVELYYGYTFADNVGRVLTGAGAAVALAAAVIRSQVSGCGKKT